MARHGENIRKRADGRWEGRYQIFDVERSRKKYCSIYGKSYEEVKEKLIFKKTYIKEAAEREKTECKMSNWSETRNYTLAFVAEEWLVEVKKKKKPSTYVKYKLIYHNYFEKKFCNTSLHEVKKQIVEETEFLSLSDSIQKSIYCVLNQILKFAAQKYSMTFPNLKRPVSSTKKQPVKVLTKSEQAKLFAALSYETNLFKMAILLCLYTGLRLGELCALKWTDINFKNKIITVSRTVQRLYVEGYTTKTILLETEPKSGYSMREIPLSDAASKLLTEFRGEWEYVFGREKAADPRTMQYHFKKYLKEAELSDKNFHILRHTFATNCIEGGTDVKSLSEILGHSDVQITLNRYVHPSMDTKRRYLDGLSSFYGQIHGQVCSGNMMFTG